MPSYRDTCRYRNIRALSNVRVGIYPTLSYPTQTLSQNAFELFDDIGYAENFLSDGPRLLVDDVERYEKILARLWRDGVEGDGARELILAAIADLPG